MKRKPPKKLGRPSRQQLPNFWTTKPLKLGRIKLDEDTNLSLFGLMLEGLFRVAARDHGPRLEIGRTDDTVTERPELLPLLRSRALEMIRGRVLPKVAKSFKDADDVWEYVTTDDRQEELMEARMIREWQKYPKATRTTLRDLMLKGVCGDYAQQELLVTKRKLNELLDLSHPSGRRVPPAPRLDQRDGDD